MPWFDAPEKGSDGERGNLPAWAVSRRRRVKAVPLLRRNIKEAFISATREGLVAILAFHVATETR